VSLGSAALEVLLHVFLIQRAWWRNVGSAMVTPNRLRQADAWPRRACRADRVVGLVKRTRGFFLFLRVRWRSRHSLPTLKPARRRGVPVAPRPSFTLGNVSHTTRLSGARSIAQGQVMMSAILYSAPPSSGCRELRIHDTAQPLDLPTKRLVRSRVAQSLVRCLRSS